MMKRPDINIDRHNLLYYVVVGIGWLLVGLLDIFRDEYRLVASASAIINALMIVLLLYVIIGRKEKNDEMTLTYQERAMTMGFYVMTFMILLLLSADQLLKWNVPFQVYGHIILGIGFIVTGLKFRQLEQDGD